jgi:quercetin dioxygenase-like cupin family protein
MELRKYRWSRVYESAEEELVDFLADRAITAERWAAEPGQVFAVHSHEFDKKLWCGEGTVIFTINGKEMSLQPGDGLDLPVGIAHSAVAGFGGCVCYEAPTTNPIVPA